MTASQKQVFSEAKDLIVEGLAVRLNPHQAIMEREKYKINLEPRELYKPKNEF